MPDLYVITGANGSGKSTVGFSYLPKIIQDNYNVFDGDKLAMQKRIELYKTKVTPSFKEARRLADEWLYELFDSSVKQALDTKDNFAYEGHFPDDENWETIKRFKKGGYTIHFIFFGLRDTDLSELRVKDRAIHGGHDVPRPQIERNYYRNLYQLDKRYRGIDELQIVDTSASNSHKVLALFKKGQIEFALHHGKLPLWFEKYLPKIYKKIIKEEPPIKGNTK
jgi:predicted ABC-type ATPase